jgi:hypothetical protein
MPPPFPSNDDDSFAIIPQRYIPIAYTGLALYTCIYMYWLFQTLLTL